jgi:hypothetical protein
MTDLLLTLSAELPERRIAQITRDLSRDLSREGISSKPMDGQQSGPDARGDPVTIGVIALALVTGGTIKDLIKCLTAHLSKEKGLKVRVTRPDGLLVEITSKNVATGAIQEALEAAVSAKPG